MKTTRKLFWEAKRNKYYSQSVVSEFIFDSTSDCQLIDVLSAYYHFDYDEKELTATEAVNLGYSQSQIPKNNKKLRHRRIKTDYKEFIVVGLIKIKGFDQPMQVYFVVPNDENEPVFVIDIQSDDVNKSNYNELCELLASKATHKTIQIW